MVFYVVNIIASRVYVSAKSYHQLRNMAATPLFESLEIDCKLSIDSCFLKGLMHVNGVPVAAFDPEGLIFAAGVDSEMVKLYDLRSFDKVISMFCKTML